MPRFALLAVGAMAWSDPSDVKPLCADMGTAYVTAEKIGAGPNGAYVLNALSCQQSCAATLGCTKFTWKRDTTPMTGGCWLISDTNAETQEDPHATSGPRACDSASASSALSVSGSAVPISISDARIQRSGASAKELRGEMLEAKAQEANTPVSGRPSGAMTFLFGLVAVAGAIAVTFGIAGAAYAFLGQKPSKTRSVQEDEEDAQDEEKMEKLIDEAPTPSTPSTMPDMSVSARGLVAMPPTLQVGPTPQLQHIQSYQPPHASG